MILAQQLLITPGEKTMILLKAILVGLSFWLSTGLGLALIWGLREGISTGDVLKDRPGYMFSGRGLAAFVVSLIAGIAVARFIGLVIAAMYLLRPWACTRLLITAPIWGLLIGAVSLLAAHWTRPHKTSTGLTFNSCAWLLAGLSLVLWCVPWIWKRIES
jgi:hypothetical protein